MAYFGESSRKKFQTLHPNLQVICTNVIVYYNFSIIWGFRNKTEQNEDFSEGNSTRKWPDSNHNVLPSNAVDIAPYPINWKNKKEFFFLAGLFMAEARKLEIGLKWGGRWKNLKDLGHFELL